MKSNISIFIGGSTDETKEERECLKVLANDLSSEYRSQGLRVNAMSYKNFDDNQTRYNDFIENEADIVMFILKGKIGDRTQEEFIKAAEAWRKKQLPEIVVFLHQPSIKDTVDIGKIYGLMEGLLNQQYPVKYHTLDELKEEAKIRIGRHIKKSASITKPPQNTSATAQHEPTVKNQNTDPDYKQLSRQPMNYVRWTWILATALLLVGGYILWNLLLRPTKPILVFAGGGSVAQFIKSNYGINVDDYDNSIYERMPSAQSWTLLAEEVNRIIQKDNSENKFYPISLSADEAPQKAFIKACTETEFKNHAAVVSCYMGEDTLVLYLSDQLRKEHQEFGKQTIQRGDLELLIQLAHTNQLQILHTTPTSGTLRAWQRFMSPADSIFIESDSTSIFNEISNLDIITNKERYAILGSRHYFMQKLNASLQDEQTKRGITIRKENGQVASKPIYLYFVAYYTELPDKTRLWIPNDVMTLLTKLNLYPLIQNNANDNIWNVQKGYINSTGGIVIHLVSRPDSLKVN